MDTRKKTSKTRQRKTARDGEPEGRKKARAAGRPSKTGAHQEHRRFPIVGVGASAGGLEAFTQLLTHLKADTGMGFVLVQHLDPGRSSSLTQLLSRATHMPVHEISNNLPVEPDHVYVIPPNANLSLLRGVLKLQRRPAGRSPIHSIDTFFESLARDQGKCAVGVILSGTASDGTVGLEAIKTEGGITFAQDSSARYDSMPRGAAAAGCVDLVLSPEDIARELGRMAQHPYWHDKDGNAGRERAGTIQKRQRAHRPPPDESFPSGDGNRSAFKKMLWLLSHFSGVDFSLYKSSTVHRRIAWRMLLNKIAELPAYAAHLQSKPKELEALYADLLINVTSFFRNPAGFEALKRKVFPKILQQSSEKPPRVWVAGCSTGQEAYSIAMAYVEAAEQAGSAVRLQIFATDLNEALLNKARAGFYDKSQVKDVSAERLRRFFVQEEGGCRVVKLLREMIVFARHNILADPPFLRMDLISCRNLLIYLESDLQRKLLPMFHYALKPGGFLFLGESESSNIFPDLFEAVDRKYKLFHKISGPAGQLTLAPQPSGGRAEPALPKPDIIFDTIPAVANAQREADRMTIQRFAPPSVLVNSQMQVVQFRGDTSPFLRPAAGQASFHVLKMAREGLMLPLRAAIKKAAEANRVIRHEGAAVIQNGAARSVNFEVVPLTHLKERCYLVFFEPAGLPREKGAAPALPPPGLAPIPGKGKPAGPEKPEESSRNRDLQRELAETRDYVQSIQEQYEATAEELQSSNEEVTSSNEELQSINEELETSKEELESANEELITLNDELANRNEDLRGSNADLFNLYSSIKMALLVLSRDLLIRRFTPEAGQLFNLSAHDLGHSVIHLRHNLELADFPSLLRKTMTTRREQECEVRDRQGRSYSLRTRPYLVDNIVEGVAIIAVDIETIKRNERKVSAAREYAEAILRTTRYPFLVLDQDLRIHTANPPFYKMFKVSPRQTVGRSLFEIGHKQWNDPKLRSLLEDILPRNSFFEDFEITRDFEKLGRRTMLLNARRMEESGADVPARVLLAIDDITAGKQLEDLRVSELRYRRLFEAAQDGVLMIDFASRRVTAANPFMAELLGYGSAEILEKDLCEIGLFQDRKECEQAFRQWQEKGSYRNGNLPCRTQSGAVHELELISSLYEEQGRRVVQCNIRDISERKANEDEKARRDSQQQYLFRFASALNGRLTQEATYDTALEAILGCLGADRAAILLADEQRVMRFKAWRGLSDKYRKAVEGHSPWLPDVQAPEPVTVANLGADRSIQADLRAAIRKEGVGAMAFVPLVYHGQLIGKFMIYYNQPHSFSHEDLQLAQTISNQLAFALERLWSEDAERRATEQLANQAAELERLVTERTASLRETVADLESFSYSIAHDLRAPLRAVHSFTSLLIEACGENLSPAGKDYGQRITRAVARMDKLIQDVLSYGRVMREEASVTPVELKRLLEGILESYPQFSASGAEVVLEGEFPKVQANEAFLTQCLSNLLSNAVKFVAEGTTPRVRVWAKCRGARVRLYFADNGIGIAKEHERKIFEMFQRVSHNYEGTGIGLAIVKKAAERMGASVGMESEPQKGSTFWLELNRAM